MHKENQKPNTNKRPERPREVSQESKSDDRRIETKEIVILLQKILEHLERMEKERKGL